MGTINHIRVARSNHSVALECEKEHRSGGSDLGDEFPFWLRGAQKETERDDGARHEEWSRSKNRLCGTCFELKSVSGSCSCTE